MLLLLALFAATNSYAADPVRPASHDVAIQPLLSLAGLKVRLFWLRDATITALAPLHDSAVHGTNFDAQHELFKPLNPGRDLHARDPAQQEGLTVGDNLKLLYEWQSYQSRSEAHDFGVKLALHYQFR